MGRTWARALTMPTEVNRSGAAPDDPAEPRLRLLVIQESPAEAGQLRDALGAAAAAVDIEFSHALADAEHRVRHHHYDCVLLDLSLPNANGVDNVQRIRAANRGQTV